MRLPDGVYATLSTAVVAGLAVGLSIGGRTFFEGDGEGGTVEEPTEEKPVLSDDLCTLMADFVLELEQMDEAMTQSSFLLAGDPDDPATLEGLREFGRLLLEVTDTAADYLAHGAGTVSDPAISKAFTDLALSMVAIGEFMGEPAVDTASLESYTQAMMAKALDPELQTTINAGDAAKPIVEQHVLNTCGIDLYPES